MLEAFCRQRGLIVNLVKTKVMLLAGDLGSKAAVAAARLAGSASPASNCRLSASSAAWVRSSAAARRWLHQQHPTLCTRAPGNAGHVRCNLLGLEATRMQLLFNSIVDSKLSYGSEVWARHLAQLAAKQAEISGSTGTQGNLSAPEELHVGFLRLRKGKPTAAVLAEVGVPPLYGSWLVRMARSWNDLLRRPASRLGLERQALDASLDLVALRPAGNSPWAPWAAQVAAAMRAAGVAFDPTQRQPLSPLQVQHDAIARYLQRIVAEAASHTLLRHYFGGAQRQPDSRQLWTHPLRTGGAAVGLAPTSDAAERWRAPCGVTRRGRLCPHCAGLGRPGGIESAHHIPFECPL